MNHLLEAALKYSALGWQVFPVHSTNDGQCSCGNPKCRDVGKHPWTAHGFKDATTDERLIREWWVKYPQANIGIRTGEASGLVVVDIDSLEAKEKLKEILGYDITEGPTVKTGDGWQSYFKHLGIRMQNRTAILDGLDFRGDGGYVIAPPSVHFTGNLYRWIAEPTGDLPDLPQKLSELIDSDDNKNGLSSRERTDMSEVLAGVPKGERNDKLFRAACKLRGADVPQEIVRFHFRDPPDFNEGDH
jgi:hypothetical protein